MNKAQNYQNYSKFIKNYFDNCKYIDFPGMIASTATKLLLNNGITFHTEDNKILEKYEELNEYINFQELFKKIAYNNSYAGKTLLIAEKTKEGKAVLSMVDMFNSPIINTKFDNIDSAELVIKVGKDRGFNYIKEIWDTKKVIRSVFSDKSLKNSIKGGESKGILDKLNLSEKWVHNFGFCPIIEIINQPRINLLGSSFFEYYPDWINVAGLIKIANNIIERFEEELETNHTYLSMNLSQQEALFTFDKNNNVIGSNSKILQGTDYISNVRKYVKTGRIIHNTLGISGEQKNSTNITFGDSKFLLDNIQSLSLYKKEIYEGAGFSFVDNRGAQKSNDEVQAISKLDYQTTMEKKNHIEPIFNKLLKWLFKIENCNFKDEDYHLEINSVIAEQVDLETLQKEFEIGIITHKELIMKRRGFTSLQAEKWLNNNKKELDEKKAEAQGGETSRFSQDTKRAGNSPSRENSNNKE